MTSPDWQLRNVPAHLRERYLAEGHWNDRTLGELLAEGLAAHPDQAMNVHSRIRPSRGTYADVEAEALLAAGAQRVAALEQKNLALETLRKLLNDEIRITERTNLVQSRKFREALEAAMLNYTNRAITTAEMITQLRTWRKSVAGNRSAFAEPRFQGGTVRTNPNTYARARESGVE
jgi:non-ribosomal peptide synthetase component E (peptide arylation enzyme)